jgi:hypothetical protein
LRFKPPESILMKFTIGLSAKERSRTICLPERSRATGRQRLGRFRRGPGGLANSRSAGTGPMRFAVAFFLSDRCQRNRTPDAFSTGQPEGPVGAFAKSLSPRSFEVSGDRRRSARFWPG